MNRFVNAVRSNILSITSIAFLVLVFTACNKVDTPQNNPRIPAAGLMAFNMTTDKSEVGITLSGNNFISTPLGFASYTGAYVPVFLGVREVRSFDGSTGSTLAIANQDFKDSAYYSLFITGANGNYQNLLIKDPLDSLPTTTGHAFVRYINAVPDSSKPIVTITANGTDLVNTSASYAALSNFTSVAPGDITVAINSGLSIAATRLITVEKDKVYTILLVGTPGSADPVKAVQVKYVLNGRLTP